MRNGFGWGVNGGQGETQTHLLFHQGIRYLVLLRTPGNPIPVGLRGLQPLGVRHRSATRLGIGGRPLLVRNITLRGLEVGLASDGFGRGSLDGVLSPRRATKEPIKSNRRRHGVHLLNFETMLSQWRQPIFSSSPTRIIYVETSSYREQANRNSPELPDPSVLNAKTSSLLTANWRARGARV